MSANTANSINQEANPFDDPLFLNNSDYSGMEVIGTKFNGQNYISWCRAVNLALGSKNKLGFLDGSTAMPALTSSTHKKWLRSDYMVRCWLINSMDEDLKESFLSCKSSKQLWSEVRERYGQTNAPLLFQLKKELRNISQENSSVVEYFNKLKRNWDDIEELESYPDCTCGAMASCTCNLLKRILDNTSFERVMNFLMGLGDSYETLRTNILAMDPVPNINRVYSIIRQAESQKLITNGLQVVPESSALSAGKSSEQKPWNVWKREQSQQSQQTEATDNRWCNHCKKGGHTKDACFVLHPEKKAKYFARFPPKGSKGGSGGTSGRFSGNAEVHNAGDETPLEFQANASSSQNPNKFAKYDPELVTAVYQDMLQRMQSKQADMSIMNHSDVNFAGPCF